jgi:hypothetical protein
MELESVHEFIIKDIAEFAGNWRAESETIVFLIEIIAAFYIQI